MGDESERVVTLPSGRVAKVRRGLGRDLLRAQRVAGPQGEPSAVIMALAAELATIDGKRVVYEDILAMDVLDVLALQAAVLGPNFTAASPAAPPSPGSSDGDLGAPN